jgi:hypothetical protein
VADHLLDALRARLDALASDGDSTDRRWDAYVAVLDRLAAIRRDAEAAGWTSLALERDGPAERFRLFGIPPGNTLRAEVPDAVVGLASDASV